ncbi:MAG: hypothetical protein K6T99_00585 [Armatimonadetes bacterium]|nr:hypothetical protein [Armatimonadota bacterium]
MTSMRWFYIVLISAAGAVTILSLQRLFNWPRTIYFEAIVAVAIATTIISLFGFISKLRE